MDKAKSAKKAAIKIVKVVCALSVYSILLQIAKSTGSDVTKAGILEIKKTINKFMNR